MLTVDLSNIWGQVSLPELLALEPELAQAHRGLLGLEEGTVPPGWLAPPDGAAVTAIEDAGKTIRQLSQCCLVLSPRGLALGACGVIAALGGPSGGPELRFAGESLSTRAQGDLLAALEGKNISLLLISPQGMEPEFAAALRALRWLLERKHGTREAARRIFAVTCPDSGLDRTARDQGWQRFPFTPTGPFDCEGAQWLLPMAVAGVDIAGFLEGAAAAREEYLTASFENSLWLHAGVRNLMGRRGRGTELLCTQEPGLDAFGNWWRHAFAGDDVFPATALLPRDSLPQAGCFATALRPEREEKPIFLDADWKNRDGLGHLEGKPLDFLEDTLWQAAGEQADRGSPVLSVECGSLNEKTLGELSAFFSLSAALSARLQDRESSHRLGEDLSRLLGQTTPDVELPKNEL